MFLLRTIDGCMYPDLHRFHPLIAMFLTWVCWKYPLLLCTHSVFFCFFANDARKTCTSRQENALGSDSRQWQIPSLTYSTMGDRAIFRRKLCSENCDKSTFLGNQPAAHSAPIGSQHSACRNDSGAYCRIKGQSTSVCNTVDGWTSQIARHASCMGVPAFTWEQSSGQRDVSLGRVRTAEGGGREAGCMDALWNNEVQGLERTKSGR